MVIEFKPPKNILLTATLHIPRGREERKGVESMEENGGREGGRGKGKGEVVGFTTPTYHILY